MPAIAPHYTKVSPARTVTARLTNGAVQIAQRDNITFEQARVRVSLEDPELFRQYLVERRERAKKSAIVQPSERLAAASRGRVSL